MDEPHTPEWFHAVAARLTKARESLLYDWERRVREDVRIPQSGGMTSPALRNHVPELIDALVEHLNGGGRTPFSAFGSEPSRTHAWDRLRQSFDVSTLLREMTHLRYAVFAGLPDDLWMSAPPVARVVSDALDEALLITAAELDRLGRAELEREALFRHRFLAILGHDLRQPLNSLSMGAAALDALLGDDCHRERKITQRLGRTARRMGRMIDSLLDAIRLQSGTLPITPVSGVDLTAVLGDVIDEARLAHPSVRIDLIAPEVVPGRWDRGRLSQTFSNLVTNAIHHGDTSEPVLLRLYCDEVHAVVSVTNANRLEPLSEDAVTELFEPFRSGADQGGHLGLGLYVAHEVVVGHGGRIDVTSDDAGTTFRVQLPRWT